MAREGAQSLWEKAEYYEGICEKETFSHPGFLLAKEYCEGVKKLLDIGCGDGSKLAPLGGRETKRFGCEVSKKAVELGQKKHPGTVFSHFGGKILPYPDQSFDRVVSFFVLEHTDYPDQLIKEAVRVTKTKGLLIFLAPNFGAPNRASPNFRGSRVGKLVGGFTKDFIGNKNVLGWKKVEPRITSLSEFQIDLDTTVEPYLLGLKRFLESLGTQTVMVKSFWEMELPGARGQQRIFRFLGELGVFPFNYWGPHLFLVGKRQ